MIRMKDWKVFCPESDRILGHVGDNLLRRLEIETDTGPEWSVVLDFEKGSGKNVAAMSRTDNILWVDLTDEMLGKNGTYTAQLRGINGEKVAHSSLFTLMINRSINAVDNFPPLKPSEFAQLEAEMHRLKAETAIAADGAGKAKTAAETAAAEAEQAVQGAGDVIEQGKKDVNSIKEAAETAAERSEEARDSILLDERKIAQAVQDAAGSAETSRTEADRSKSEADRAETEADEAAEWAAKAQGYAEQASVPAVAGVYNLVLADRMTGERYALIVEDGRLKLLGVADTLDATTMRLIDPNTGVAYELIVESGRLKTLEVE